MNGLHTMGHALLALQAEVDNLRALLDAKSHEAGLYALRMEQAQQSRDKARSEERAAVVAHLRERAIHGAGNLITVEDACTILADLFERGEHLREDEKP